MPTCSRGERPTRKQTSICSKIRRMKRFRDGFSKSNDTSNVLEEYYDSFEDASCEEIYEFYESSETSTVSETDSDSFSDERDDLDWSTLWG